ncbi:sulfurtransferase [Halocatena pleomorpha]|uniref:Sulfurtransferase n=1 Tax=Halocatena pleomorpha TaxID=1785090 RepID=A0A3P3RCE5_9EURY|nr:sulfurtransferase [Halocatena pleomorpha]RRJ30360.1 sulfurtransferase [Halocatena pleomorpha]
MDVLVKPEWVAARLDGERSTGAETGNAEGALRIVDVRDAWEFDGIGHLPGAVNVPFDSFRSEDAGETGMLPGADVFSSLLSEVGIEATDQIVAYDDMHGVFAARFLVTCELYGHPRDRLQLLNGDYSAWSRQHSVSNDEPNPTPTEYEGTFVESGPLVGLETVEQAMDDSEAVLVDTREQSEFEAGHIPGSVRLDWMELVDETERGVQPESELRSTLQTRGITPDQSIVLYCNTARRISHTYTVLRHLGYEQLAFYEGSLTEWKREGGPLATGSE